MGELIICSGGGSNAEDDIGSYKDFSVDDIPDNYIECNGDEISRETYSALFEKIGTTFGNGDGVTTFELPDLRGCTRRSLDKGRGLDQGRAIGTYQSATSFNIGYGATGAVPSSLANYDRNEYSHYGVGGWADGPAKSQYRHYIRMDNVSCITAIKYQ